MEAPSTEGATNSTEPFGDSTVPFRKFLTGTIWVGVIHGLNYGDGHWLAILVFPASFYLLGILFVASSLNAERWDSGASRLLSEWSSMSIYSFVLYTFFWLGLVGIGKAVVKASLLGGCLSVTALVMGLRLHSRALLMFSTVRSIAAQCRPQLKAREG